MPGETSAVFGDALRRLASNATYLYQDGTRYWYSTRTSGDEAGRRSGGTAPSRSGRGHRRNRARVQKRCQGVRGLFPEFTFSASSQDVPDDLDARRSYLASTVRIRG